MAIGDLLYERVMDFATNPVVPTSGFGNGVTTGSYDAASSSLKIVTNGAVAGLLLPGEPPSEMHDCELEVTLKVAVDGSGNRSMGLFLIHDSGLLPTGYRAGHFNGTRSIWKYSDANPAVLATASDTVLTLNQVYKLLVRKTGALIEYFLDGVLKNSTSDSLFRSVMPAIYVTNGTYLVSKVIWRIKDSGFSLDRVYPIRSSAIPANQETRAKFQPQDVAWRGGEGNGFPGPMTKQPITDVLLSQPGQDLFWTRDGVLIPQGYIESTVTISGQGVRRRVLCYTQAGELVGETWSRASDGKYRFDLLWLNRSYMLVAQDDPTFGPADYNAVAADYQQPTPYAPGQGVGLN